MNNLVDDQAQGSKSRHNCKFQSNYTFKNNGMKYINQLCEHYNELGSNYDNLTRMNNELHDSKPCYYGGGDLTNKSMYTTNQMYKNICNDGSPLEATYLKEKILTFIDCDNICPVNRMFMKVYNSGSLCSHILPVCGMEEDGVGMGSDSSQQVERKRTWDLKFYSLTL